MYVYVNGNGHLKELHSIEVELCMHVIDTSHVRGINFGEIRISRFFHEYEKQFLRILKNFDNKCD